MMIAWEVLLPLEVLPFYSVEAVDNVCFPPPVCRLWAAGWEDTTSDGWWACAFSVLHRNQCGLAAHFCCWLKSLKWAPLSTGSRRVCVTDRCNWNGISREMFQKLSEDFIVPDIQHWGVPTALVGTAQICPVAELCVSQRYLCCHFSRDVMCILLPASWKNRKILLDVCEKHKDQVVFTRVWRCIHTRAHTVPLRTGGNNLLASIFNAWEDNIVNSFGDFCPFLGSGTVNQTFPVSWKLDRLQHQDQDGKMGSVSQ